MMKKILLVLVSCFTCTLIAQETVGLIFDDFNEIKSDGYTLFKPNSDNRVFLIDGCGEVVNEWTSSGTNSRNAYLLENGTLLQSSGFVADIRDWNDNVLWSIDYQAEFGFRIHHDIEPLPNGNFLVLIRDIYTNTELFAEGLDTSFPEDILQLERIVEIEPVGTDSANIVWEWKLFDHLVQDFDSSKPNFGVVANNPQLLDINFDNGNGSNPIHANALDYNETLDQIAISARHLSEVFIIDHSTSTAEAAMSTGGNYGKGGDLLWRWGNPEVYDQGTALDRKLGRQHDIKWIMDGSHQGKMSVFCNDGYGDNLTASSVHIIDPNDTNGVYGLSSGKFLPETYFWSWDGIIMNTVMHAGAQSGFQIMPNGNGLINESFNGRITEINPSGEVVWVYRIPVGNNSNFDQFTEPIANGSFRAHRYPENYSGFNNVTFNNTGILENVNTISDDCVNRLSVDNYDFQSLSAYPNPTKDVINFTADNPIDQIEVYSITGKRILSKRNSSFIDVESLANGVYMVKLFHDNSSKVMKILKR
ncbi:aryl-sulfate sulfotransferase [Winogradskyella flava]|uniref:Aryl-sulfate sulfotransferase n=1 Tax=Winogradskyella flava TaxID=1884876 RepID=A0A842ITK1_9FLAO|nr:aryl-sulfate sulfotransferase [Winogradskyella flava]MBC2845489.1 aryl-sulfate sulfotransferase [Winogradskyella flava]